MTRRARRRDQGDRRHRPEPHLRPAPLVRRGARLPARIGRPGSATSSATARARTAPGRRRTGSPTSVGPAWTRVPDGQWYCHLFAPEQPDLNWDNREVRDDFLTTLRFWADRGVDGFRVDVAHALAKDLSEPLRSKPTLEDHPTMPDRRHRPAVRPRRGARDLSRVARGLRLLRPAPHRGRRGVRAVVPARPLRPAHRARSGLQLRPAGRRLRRRGLPRRDRLLPEPGRGVGLVLDLGAVQPRRGPARHPLRPAHRHRPGRVADVGRQPAARRRGDRVSAGPAPRRP